MVLYDDDSIGKLYLAAMLSLTFTVVYAYLQPSAFGGVAARRAADGKGAAQVRRRRDEPFFDGHVRDDLPPALPDDHALRGDVHRAARRLLTRRRRF
jgi:hypothetical protein